MNTISIIAIALVMIHASLAAQSEPVVSLQGKMLGKHYESVVSVDDLKSQPKWNPLSSTIPLSIDKACESALAFANKEWNFHNVIDPEAGQWAVKSALLERIAKTDWDRLHSFDWIYTIEIIQRGPIQGLRMSMKLIVLLNGRVVQPKLVEDADSKDKQRLGA